MLAHNIVTYRGHNFSFVPSIAYDKGMEENFAEEGMLKNGKYAISVTVVFDMHFWESRWPFPTLYKNCIFFYATVSIFALIANMRDSLY